MPPEIHGHCPPRFEGVREVFEAAFAAGEEIGARFTACEGGEVVLDLWAGTADRAGTRPFDAETLAPVFSLTKAFAATMVAWASERGKLDYEQPVADLWPEFAQAGKAEITVAQALSHQAGLSGFAQPMVPDLWFDWDAVCDRVAAMTPMWAPGTASGYGPQLWGYVAGEIFRRADGRMLGRALAEEFARPFGLDLYIGLPESEDARLAELRKPPGLSDFGERNEPTKAAFLQPWSSPRSNSDQWRRVENPAANGITTASAAARLLGVMATGAIGGRRVLSPETIAAAGRERICGPDLVLPHTVSWGAGFMRSGPDRVFGPDPDAFGHYGWGGSCGMADPRRGLSAAYVTTRQSIALVADPRALRLIGALYAAF